MKIVLSSSSKDVNSLVTAWPRTAQKHYDNSGLLVYVLHLSDLVTSFIVVSLIDTDRIDPHLSVLVIFAQMQQGEKKVVGDLKRSAVQDNRIMTKAFVSHIRKSFEVSGRL